MRDGQTQLVFASESDRLHEVVAALNQQMIEVQESGGEVIADSMRFVSHPGTQSFTPGFVGSEVFIGSFMYWIPDDLVDDFIGG